MSSHVINKIQFLIPAPGYEEARMYQLNVKGWSDQYLPGLLNIYLDKINSDDSLVMYDRVEIEVNKLPWMLTGAEWEKAFEKHFKQQPNLASPVGAVVKHWIFYLKNGCFERAASLKSILEIQHYFMAESGRLTFADFNDIQPGDISLEFLQRLFFQHERQFVIMILEKLWRIPVLFSRELYDKIKTSIAVHPDKAALFSRRLLQGKTESSTLVNRSLDAFISETIHVSKEPLVERVERFEPLVTTEKTSLAGSFINCPNAGLALLLPFIQKFFENNNLVANDHFIDPVAQRLGIQSLFFLATGRSFAGEDEYVLPKLVCGANVDEYLDFENGLPQTIQQEAEELLQSVIEYWEKLRNSSITTLRETFLIRGGKLIPGDETWTLQVETSGVDILLNSLPWGFRSYRLPWMHTNLVTEWY